MSEITFETLHLSSELKRAISDMGFVNPTPIQAKSIPLIQSGVDVIGKSQTGTGKTGAFLIPILEKIETRGEKNLEALVLCPTRELAMQAADEARKLTKYKHGIKTVAVYGGEPIERQIKALKHGVNIVIGTPGRVMDHMRRHTLKFQNLKTIILDEADEMLSMGFIEDIETILSAVPKPVQTVLFSATMPPAILALTKQYQTDPQLVEIAPEQLTVEAIKQAYYSFPMAAKEEGLIRLLTYYESPLSLIFCNTKRKVEEIYTLLTKNGIEAERLHGDMKQSQRTEVMRKFKSGKVHILIATDVAARGIDVDDIQIVFNYDIPQNDEYYVHRIGRTGRAGKSGLAVSLVSGRRQIAELRRMAHDTQSEIEKRELPSDEELYEKADEKCLESMREKLAHRDKESYAHLVSALMGEGYAAEDIASAAMSLAFGNRKRPKRSFDRTGAYTKLYINIGKDQKIAPNFIVGAICERCDLRGNDIGKIAIYETHTIVEVPTPQADDVIEKMKHCKINGVMTKARRYEDKPFSAAKDTKKHPQKKKDGYEKKEKHFPRCPNTLSGRKKKKRY